MGDFWSPWCFMISASSANTIATGCWVGRYRDGGSPQVSGCLLLVGWKISVFIYKKGWLACSTEVKQKFDTTVESVCVYLCTMWAAHIGNYIDLLMNIMNILDFIAMFWNWKRDRHMALRLNLGLKGQSLNWSHVGSYIFSLSCWLVSNAEHTCKDQSAEGEAHPQGRINSISSLCIICACSVSESVEICSGNWLLSSSLLMNEKIKCWAFFMYGLHTEEDDACTENTPY